MLLSATRHFLLTITTTALLVLGGWQANPAWATSIPDPPPSPSMLAAQARQAVVAAREEQTARIAAELETMAAHLRRIRPYGADAPSSVRVMAGLGDAEPIALAQQVLQSLDKLSNFEAQIEADWRAEAAEMAEQGFPAAVVERHVGLLSDVLARAAELRARISPLRAAVAQRSASAVSTQMLDLSEWFAGQDTTRAYAAIGSAQLPIELVRAQDTPGPSAAFGAAVEADTAKLMSAQSGSPLPADLAPNLDVQITPEIQALAQSLGSPVAIRNWVYDHISFDPTWGSIQGSALTLLNRRGNSFDIASLTLALLRAAGIPARYGHSVVELPVEQVQNWLGGLSTPEMALDLIQKGGVPSVAVIQGGRIHAIRFEHIWAEAYVDFIPSRGAINRVPDQWVPMDVAFKQYDVSPGVQWAAITRTAREDVVRGFAQRITVGPNNALSGFDFDFLSQGMSDTASQLAQTVNTGQPAGTTVRFDDTRQIRPIDSLILEGSLPFPLRSATVQRYSELPANLRQSLRIRFYTDQTSVNFDSPARDISIPLVRLGTKRLAARYAPATAADAAALEQFATTNASSMPLAQINVIPRLELDDELLFEHNSGRMGTLHFWKADIRDAHGHSLNTEAYRFAAGSDLVFVPNLAGVDADRAERENADAPAAELLPTRDALYYGGLLYWLLHNHLDDQAARSVGGRALRLPSIGAFTSPLQVRYFFGIPRTGFVAGRTTDVKAARVALSTPVAADLLQVAVKLGAGGSLSEGAAWAILSGSYNSGFGVSASTVIYQAIEEGQKLYQIDSTNVVAALAQMQLSPDAENEILQAAMSGWIVVAPERDVQIRSWSGTGYVVIDPETGSSLQRLEGGYAGAIEVGCIVKAVILYYLCKRKIIAAAKKYLLRIGISVGTRALAATGLATLFTGAGVVVGVVLPILAAVGLGISIAMATMEVVRWVRGIMDGWELLTPEELAELGINNLNEVACSYLPPCLDGLLGAAGGAIGGMLGSPDEPESPSGGRRPKGSSGPGGPLLGNPVAAGTGAKWQAELHYTGIGPFPLQFLRTYNSDAPQKGGWLGAKWTADYFQAVELPPDAGGNPFPVTQRPDAVLLSRPDGGWIQFNYSNGAYTAAGPVYGQLERLTAGGQTIGWRYRTEEDRTETYDPHGRLLTIRNRAGLTHTVDYDTILRPSVVTDAFGRTLTFNYDEDTGYLASITDPAQRQTRFTYDEFGNLTEIQHPGSEEVSERTRRFHYEDIGHRYHLTGLTDERGVRLSTWRYDHKGRVKSYERAGGVDRHTFSYAKDTTIVIDPYETERRYEYQRIDDQPYLRKVTQPCSSCGGGDTAEYTYTARGFIETTRDFRGNLTRYQRNARGQITAVTEAQGTPEQRSYSYDWHANWFLPTRIVEPVQGGNRVSVLGYDSAGNLLSRAVTAGPQTRTWSWTFNSNGQVLTADGPRTDVVDITTYTYDTEGNLASKTDALNHAWTYPEYSADGQLVRMIDPNGLESIYSYDARQRLNQINTDGEITSYTYTPFSATRRVASSDGSFIEYEYDDAQRLTAYTDALGQRMVYSLNAAGEYTQMRTLAGNGDVIERSTRQFDALGRVQNNTGANPDEVWAYTFDGNGNQKSRTDPLTHTTASNYDALDRLIKTTDPALSEIEYGYDPQDNLIRVEDPRNLVTHYQWNGFNEQTRLTSPDTGITDYTYDSAGNLKTRSDARNIVVSSDYDADNRIIETRYPATADTPAEVLSFRYDEASGGPGAKGKLTSISDGSGGTQFVYDRDGRLTSRQQTVIVSGTPLTSTNTAYSYNANGQLQQTTLPSGAVVGYSYGADGRAISISVNGQVIARDIEYFAFGEPKSWTYNAADRYVRNFDSNGRVSAHTAGTATRSISFDRASRITGISDGAGSANQWNYEYDELDRLKLAVNASTTASLELQQLNLGWTFDRTGNRLTESKGAGALPPSPTRSFAIQPSSNRLASIAPAGSAPVPRSYDPVGNTLLDDEGRASVYNGRNRLAQLTRAGLTARYQHNAFGERVSKTVAGASSQYVYDQDGHLIGEYAADGGLLTETLWLGDVPMAVLKPSSFAASHGGRSAGSVAVFFAQPDQLDSPRVIVNASNTPVWRWDSAPFGDTIANEQPSGGAIPAFRYDLRFPGQQYDSESGLHYNYFRDYEPGAGRYVQSDPIGLEGGVNTFTYVINDPLGKTDPFGNIHGNSNDHPGPCHLYLVVGGWRIYKIGESCNGRNKEGLSKRCESQAARLEKETGKRHRCVVTPDLPCTKRTIKLLESIGRVCLRLCGAQLPGNNEHNKGKKK